MAENTERDRPQAQASTERPRIKMTPNPATPEQIYIDGISGVYLRSGVIKMDCYRVVGRDREDNAEVSSITHRLVMPADVFPALVRMMQDVVTAARQAQEQAAEQDDAEKLI